jgi:hypothetical protein
MVEGGGCKGFGALEEYRCGKRVADQDSLHGSYWERGRLARSEKIEGMRRAEGWPSAENG